MKSIEPKRDINQLKEELTLNLKHIQKLNEALSSAKKKAGESDALKSAFLSNIRHEIYTPMNAIIGFSNILSTTRFSRVKTEKFNQMINTSCKRLFNVLDEIIDISIIDADQIILNNELVNINILINKIFEYVKFHFKKKYFRKGTFKSF